MNEIKYKWELRKGSKKEICPSCGQKRFVPYVSTSDKVTLAGARFGRCDREQNCGYSCYPDKDINAPLITDAPKAKQLKPIRFAREFVKVKRSVLFDYVAELVTLQSAFLAWDLYKVGATKDGRTIFWQIDYNGEIRGAKAIRYKPDGHRDKNAFPPVSWLHKEKDWACAYEGEELQQCFFGEHLLKDNTKPVAIVESEKTAICMSAFFPRYVWLACGGSQNLKAEEKHEVLKGRDVMLIPDNAQFWQWKKIAEKYNYHINDYIEKNPIFEGCDILDYFDATNKKMKLKL